MNFKILIFLIFTTHYAYGKQRRIIGGLDATRDHFPYQAILRRISNDILIGGGAIIGFRHILTAAHCVDERFNSRTDLKIYLGNSNEVHSSLTVYRPFTIYSHPGYTGQTLNNAGVPSNDIAIIKLRFSIEFNRYKQMIPLPNTNIEFGDTATITGWGLITYPTILFPVSLQEARMSVIDNTRCKPLFPREISSDQFCAFATRGVGPCFGDNGGPLVSDGKLIGIYSLSYGCAQGLPDVYTSVYSHDNFIRITMLL